jgi:hypothetical protein
VQPLIAKLALPLLGGTPAVWAVSLCVFQGLLLAGYCYAHVVGTRLAPAAGVAVHLAVLAAGAAMLPVGLGAGAAVPPTGGYHLWLAGVLVASIGLPFFALSANAPLLQKWYAGLGRADSADPYRLYVASNAGSLLALLAYPLLIEPLLPMRPQRLAWSVGYGLLIAAIAVCGLVRIGAAAAAGSAGGHAVGTAAAAGTAAVDARTRLAWVALALVPSGLLVAFTTFLTTDLASAPLLWVIPLALYLASFLVVFRDPMPLAPRALAITLLAAVAVMQTAMEWNAGWTWAVSALAGLAAFVCACLICHRLLYEARPPAARLTEFYFCMSLGGVLGGVAAALLAPLLFVDVVEFALLLVAALVAGLVMHHGDRPGTPAARLAEAAAVAVLATLLVAAAVARLTGWGTGLPLRFWATIAASLALAAALPWPRAATLLAIATLLGAVLLPPQQPPLHITRSFFGTHRVVAVAGGQVHSLLHGTTIHGAELRRDGTGRLPARPLPLTYYHPSGPLARSIGLARAAAGGQFAPINAGIVGLGAGAIACYAGPRDAWRFYELDPDVVRIARTPDYFRYLTVCRPDAEIVLGDARQTLDRRHEREGARFDFMLIDAFSSDAIPVHLITREAISLYLSRLSPQGVLTLHVSNQNLDLIPSLEATLAMIPGIVAVYAEGTRGGGALASQAVMVAREERILAPALGWHNARRLGNATARAWTDDYSDIVLPMLRKLVGRREAQR